MRCRCIGPILDIIAELGQGLPSVAMVAFIRPCVLFGLGGLYFRMDFFWERSVAFVELLMTNYPHHNHAQCKSHTVSL